MGDVNPFHPLLHHPFISYLLKVYLPISADKGGSHRRSQSPVGNIITFFCSPYFPKITTSEPLSGNRYTLDWILR